MQKLRLHNFIVKFGKTLDIFKDFAENRVTALGNIPRRGVVPKFTDLATIALSATAEAFGTDSGNNILNAMITRGHQHRDIALLKTFIIYYKSSANTIFDACFSLLRKKLIPLH